MKARQNPLRADRVLQVRFRLAAIEPDLSWEVLLDRLGAQHWRGALVGPEGSGKTTLLEDMAPHLVARGLRTKQLQLSREAPRFAPGFLAQFCDGLESQDCVLFDGAEQMSRLTWRRFLHQARRAGGLVITSHRAGLLPILVQCRTTPALLHDILVQLLGDDAARWDSETLWTRHGGNVRLALRELYDQYAEMPDIEIVDSHEQNDN